MPNPTCPKCGGKLIKNGHTPANKIRWGCLAGRSRINPGSGCGYSTTSPESGEARSKRSAIIPVFKRSIGHTHTIVVTAAQNATPGHLPFIKNMEKLCHERSGELLAVPLRYKNPTSRFSASQANEDVWADELMPYLCNERKRLNKNLVLLGDVRVQPTAVTPLSGFEGMTHGESAILAHTKIQSKTVATPQSRLPKILSTTGAATVRNYTDSRAGKQGEFHHTLGALLIEIKGSKFQIRRLNADKKTGAFIDLDRYYGADWVKSGIADAPPALAIVHGDEHVGSTDPGVLKAQDQLAKELGAQHRVWHDLLDGYAFNPHHYGNPFIGVAKARFGLGNAEAEVMAALDFLQARGNQYKHIVVPSNHDDMLARWIMAQDWRHAPGNAEFYLETALAMVRGVKHTASGTEYPDPFTYWGRRHLSAKDNVRFLDKDESFMLANIELGMHGHAGPNGARGSIKNLRRIGVKSIIGHTHSPGEDEGCMQVGTSTNLKLEYTKGPSGWLNTDAIVYANGKRTLINYIEGEYRL